MKARLLTPPTSTPKKAPPLHLAMWCCLLLYVSHTQRAPSQAIFDRDPVAVHHGWIEGEPVTEDLSNQDTYSHAGWRAKMLDQFPGADANEDGILTEAEAIQFHLDRTRVMTPQGRELELLPKGVSRWTERVAMRDGVALPTEIYLPSGQGPWPVVLVRTTRGRIDSALDYGNELLRRGFAFVGQDLTPEGDFINADELGREVRGSEMTREERAAFNARRSQRDRKNDGYDTVEWLNTQPWCNGQIAMTGYSEGSSQSKSALAADPPSLDLLVTAIGTLSRSARGPVGVASAGQISWDGEMPDIPDTWDPKDGLRNWGTSGELVEKGAETDVLYNDRTGWFDFAVQGSINEWNSLKDSSNATLIMGISGHGAVSKDARQSPIFGDSSILFSEVEAFEMLREENIPKASRFFYFLMGDATNPDAPGNVWKVTDEWPLPHTTQHWYLHENGSLNTEKPTDDDTYNSYTYEPKDPILMAGGARMPSRHNGPIDYRATKDRDDILRYNSEPLNEPLEVTGEASVDLYFSSDAPDTSFVVTVLDIYPDGYEWPIRDTAVTARYHDGFEDPKPLEKGRIYHVNLPLISTAVMIDKGHRIGIRVTSSAFPAYAIHPNTWTAINSYDDAQVAEQRIYTGGESASRLNLPVISHEVSEDFDPNATY